MNDEPRIPVILVVDDNPYNLQLIGGMLGESQEFDLSFASSGREALDVMASILPDLVLLDVNMPDMNGFEVCRLIKGSTVSMHIPVIFLTAQGETDYIVQGFSCGGSDYVIKPFEPQELLARVRVQLELHWSRMEMRRLNDELQRVNDELRLLSSTDGLLRIANRRHFDETLVREWQRALRNGQPLSLMIIDVDHFKLYNDHYGHLEGDDCLKRVAAAIGRGVRRSADLLARYGGEEFAVILPDTDTGSVNLVAEAIHASLCQEAVPHHYSPVSDRVTVSIGVAEAVPEFGSSPEILIHAADRALYDAKDEGRNRTCFAAWTSGQR